MSEAKPQNPSWDIGPMPDRGDSAANADSPDSGRDAHRGDAGDYRLADPEPTGAAPESPEVPQPVREPTEPTFQASSDERDRQGSESFPDTPPQVSHVWSRWVEWKQPIVWASVGVALATLIVFVPAYVATLMFLAAMGYGAYCVVISLEVPVRVTPEQAIQEFFAAAGHRLPNFRRMYVLLTDNGKTSSAYSDLAQFRAYWTDQIAQFSRSPAWLVPLEFRIEGFSHRYNADKTMATVRYVVKIAPRGQAESVSATAEFDVRNLVVKGPDGQWYVNDGSLPE